MIHRHYIAGVAIEIVRSQQPNQVETQYLLKDHLGSIEKIVDKDGEIIESLKFDPFGKRKNAEMVTTKTTGTARTEDDKINAIFDWAESEFKALFDGHLANTELNGYTVRGPYLCRYR